MRAPPYVVPVLAGILNAVHSGMNARIPKSLARPWWATVFACLISGVAVAPGFLVTREAFPGLGVLARTP